MSGIWEMVGTAAGIVAFILILQLLDLPDWIGSWLRNRTPRKELETRLTELQARVAELEKKLS